MKALAAAIFVAGVGFAGFVTAAGGNYGIVEVAVLSVIVGFAVLGLAALARSGAARPAVCDACGGVVSPSAPSCKHCGSPRR